MFLGVILVLVGMRILSNVVLFYRGVQREMYFSPAKAWIGMARLGGALVIMGISLTAAYLLVNVVENWTVVLAGVAVGVAWWGWSPLWIAMNPPRWVRHLESEHPKPDLDAILQNGSAMLIHRPQQFRRIIRDEVGWETWITTVTGFFPLMTLDTYIERARQAMALELFPIAVSAAGEVIRFRPNQALGYELRAEAHFRNHQYDKARQDYDTAIQLEPERGDLYYERARLHLILGHSAASVADLELALAIDSSQTHWQNLARVARETLNDAQQREQLASPSTATFAAPAAEPSAPKTPNHSGHPGQSIRG